MRLWEEPRYVATMRSLGGQPTSSMRRRSAKTDSCAFPDPLPISNQDRILSAQELMSSDPSITVVIFV